LTELGSDQTAAEALQEAETEVGSETWVIGCERGPLRRLLPH
jgi:hypothetical protein